MSPRIKPETSVLPVVQGRRFRIRPRVWACLAILVGLGFGAHFLWLRTAPTVARDPQYALTRGANPDHAATGLDSVGRQSTSAARFRPDRQRFRSG